MDFGDELYYMAPQKPTLPVKFTGWKGDEKVGYVAQWIWYKEYGVKGSSFYYVNLPGEQKGSCRSRDDFDIGVERIRGPVDASSIKSMVARGKALLIELVKEKEGVDISKLVT